MKHISSVLLLFFFVTVAAAQEQSTGATFDGGMIGRMCMAVQKTTGAALADDGELSPLQVDASGNLRTTGSLSWSGSTTDPSKLEDAASAAGDRGMFMLGIQNRAGANYGSADLDYTPVSLNQFGGIKVELSTDFVDNTGKNPYRLEDAAFADGNALMVVGGVRQDTPASSTGADGDVINLKTDGSGYLWTRLLAADSISSVTRSEDSAHASTHSGVSTLGLVRQDTAAGMAADGDYVFGAVDSANRQYVNPWGANHTEWFKGCSGAITTATTTSIIPFTTSKYHYVTAVNCVNNHATVNSLITLVHDADGTPAAFWYLNVAAVTGSDGMQFNPPLKMAAVTQDIGVTTSGAANVYCCIEGFDSAN